jgi:hypothetical protein
MQRNIQVQEVPEYTLHKASFGPQNHWQCPHVEQIKNTFHLSREIIFQVVFHFDNTFRKVCLQSIILPKGGKFY